jgi:5,10-methylenetetrahydromethanopterin reductase
VGLLRRAEEMGISMAWLIDSQLAMKDAYMTLAVLANETRSIRLGPGVTNLVTRNETVVANAMATLASFAPGRVTVGLGAGDSSVFPIGERPLTIERCRTGLLRLRALLEGESVPGPEGPVRLSFVPQQPPPIFLAASQPRMLRLGGEVADGVIVMGPAVPDLVDVQFSYIDQGAREAGRSPGDVERDLWVTVAVGASDEATNDVKSWASAQARWLATWKEVPPSLRPFSSEMEAARDRYQFASHLARGAAHSAEISDEFARALAVAGPPDECQRRLAGLAQLGAGRITATLLSGGRERRLEQLVELARTIGIGGVEQ